jgi:SOS-response transcriptional repressors (RecA-mediated autopeptidases)
MSLADRVRNRRIELGLTQTEAAERAGIRQQSWASIEDGQTQKPRNIIGIANALECDASWLMQGGVFIPISELNVRKVPLISYVQAGALVESTPIHDIDGNFEYVLTDVELSEHSFALRVIGDSMEPDFKEGDIVIIDPEIEPAPGEFVVASNGSHEATFKISPNKHWLAWKTHFDLVPINTDYATVSSAEIPIKIIGTMVEHRIYRRKR